MLTYAHIRRITIIIGENGMKTKDLIKLLERNGWKFKRHGSDHDVYIKGAERESVPRHKEIKESLAKSIIKRRGLE